MAFCCIEDAFIGVLRDFECTPIKSENHFVNVRRCKDCYPYVVVSSSLADGLVTSGGRQKVHTVTISAYFADSMQSIGMRYRDTVNDWLSSAKCLDLGECGCFCLQRTSRSLLSSVTNDVHRFQVSFSGIYKRSEIGSVSASV